MGPTAAHPSRLRVALSVLAVGVLAAACADDADAPGAAATTSAAVASTTTLAPTTTTPEPDPRAWPEDDWSTTTAEAAGMDQAGLDQLAADAEAAGSRCLAVTRDGELVQDWYWQGTDVDTEAEAWSVTKSVTATLVGIAQDEGDLDIDQPASDFLTEWQGTESEPVTIRNLLSNDSGRFQDDATDYAQMALREPDKTAFSIGLDQQHPPGTEWVYNNSAIQTLEAVLERSTGVPVDQYTDEKLFEPLGMESDMTFDDAGNTLVFMGMQTTCRDLARFGLLYLRDGEWDGEQVVSAAFVEEAVRPSQDLNPSYGFLWWILDGGGGDTALGQGALNTRGDVGYAAIGLGDQVLAVFPETGVVVTRMGAANGGFGPAQIAEWAATVDGGSG